MRITLGTHNGTHVDAPYHYNSTIQGRPAETIDELPLERFYGRGGWDRPLQMQAADALAADARGVFWEAHQVDLPYSQIERLCNLAALPPTGFTVACFPLRIERASAAPARVVAILE
jgi:kynurenine formamidase